MILREVIISGRLLHYDDGTVDVVILDALRWLLCKDFDSSQSLFILQDNLW